MDSIHMYVVKLQYRMPQTQFVIVPLKWLTTLRHINILKIKKLKAIY